MRNNKGFLENGSDNLPLIDLNTYKDGVMAAVMMWSGALKYVSDEMKRDKDIVMAAVKKDALTLRYVGCELRADKDVALVAVKCNGLAIEYVSNELKNDKDVALVAVRCNGLAIEYVSSELKNDKEVALMAIKTNAKAYQYCGVEVQKDTDIINFVVDVFKKNNLSIDTFVCNELQELKKKYGVDTLEKALEMEMIDMEISKLSSASVQTKVVIPCVKIRL